MVDSDWAVGLLSSLPPSSGLPLSPPSLELVAVGDVPTLPFFVALVVELEEIAAFSVVPVNFEILSYNVLLATYIIIDAFLL